jgi:hypothetical protein
VSDPPICTQYIDAMRRRRKKADTAVDALPQLPRNSKRSGGIDNGKSASVWEPG